MSTNSREVSSHYVRKFLARFASPHTLASLLDDLRETEAFGPDPEIERAIRDVKKAADGILVD